MWFTNAAAFVVGLLGFAGAHLAQKPWDEVSRDIGMAFVIAAIITTTYEGYARQRAAAETMEDLLDKIVGDIVEKRTWEEMRQQILEKTALRRSTVICMKMRRDSKLPDDQRVLWVRTDYRLASLRSHIQKEPVLHFLDGYMRTEGAELPRFIRVTIDGDVEDLTGVGDRFSKNVSLPARGDADVPVSIEREELVYVPGAYSIIMSELTELESITMWDIPEDVEVQVNCLHSTARAAAAADVFEEPFLNSGTAFRPNRVLLPGQCVEIRFRKITSPCG
jgi:hypothetical protein